MSKVNNVEIKVQDSENFLKLTLIEKGIFEAYRDSLLKIFPVGDDGKTFDDDTIIAAELSAFEFVNKLPEAIKNPVTIEQVITAVTPLIAAASTAASPAPGATTK